MVSLIFPPCSTQVNKPHNHLMLYQIYIWRASLSSLPPGKRSSLLDQTLFIVSSKHLLSKTRHLPHMVLDEPPAFFNASLAYWSHTLAQIQLRLIPGPMNKVLTTCYYSPGGGGKVWETDSATFFYFLLLECEKREAYNFVQWLDREVKEEKVEEVTVRKMLRKLMDGKMTNYPLRWSWTSRNFC